MPFQPTSASIDPEYQLISNANVITGFNSIESVIVNVYPNPVSDELNVSTGKAGHKIVRVLDLSGKVVKQSFSDEANFKLNIEHLASGTYYLEVKTDSLVGRHLFIKN
ncbi:MAG: T9SS type A sorting domain-containing protein [Bacteroidia bacterium]